jgi:plasmid stabilization system protein ParE
MTRVDFAKTVGERFQALEDFILAQDPETAPAWIEDLQEQLLRFVDLVKQHPKIGRPANALAASSVEGQRRLHRVLRLAADAGLPTLREYVLRAHIVLYAHSDSHVLMLSIRHRRELGYMPK